MGVAVVKERPGQRQSRFEQIKNPSKSPFTKGRLFIPPPFEKGEAVKKFVHGSTGSPRTVWHRRKSKYLAVRPELVEGRTAIFSQLWGEGGIFGQTQLGIQFSKVKLTLTWP